MEGLPEDMWSPFKQLHRIIEQTLTDPNAASIVDVELTLKKHKQNFAAILRNPPKNERNRNQLRTGITEGITISGKNRTILLSKDLVDETIIISDMFDLDEFIALELLCTAQRQMSLHSGLPRGLVAILLYYDGRKAITFALRDLFQGTSGVSWVTDLPKEVTYVISSFTQSLVDDSNVLGRIIDLLEELDISKETMLLTKNRAFGPKKHQNQILELFGDIRLGLATALFNWSAQRGLPRTVVCKLIHSLSKCTSTEASGAIDDVTLTMLMALLYSYDTSVLQRQDNNNIYVQNLPVLSEPEFIQQVFDVLLCENSSHNRLDSLAKFAFGLTLASLRHTSQYPLNNVSKIIERDEQLVEEAISKKLFEFMYYDILEKDIIYKTEFFYRRIHIVFADFVDFMHSKVTELRGRADETAKTIMSFANEGLEPPPNLDNNFEMLMLCIGKFYKGNRAGLSLCEEYWGPIDMSSNYSKATTRSVSLFKFVRLAGELLPTTLFVPYLKMITGLTSCERSARSAFNLLKQASGLSGSPTLSWEHFFGSLTRYYSNLRQEQCPGTDTIYRHRVFNRGINPCEIEGLHAVLEVIAAVATYDEVARIAICEHPNWAPLHVLIGLLGCTVPLFLKAEILKTLAALARSKESALTLWNNLEASQIISTIPTTNTYDKCSLEVEIEQNECRIERYPLTQGTLDLLYALVTTGIPKNLGGGPRKPGFDPYLTFIVNGIFLKFYNRNYKNIAEKWEVGEKCLKLLYFLLKEYEISSHDFNENRDENPPPGFHIMLQLHTKSDMLRLILLIIDEARMKFDEYTKFHGKEKLQECALHCLNILEKGLVRQDVFFYAHSIVNSSILLSGLNKIVLDVNPRTRQPDHILNTSKFITYFSWLPNHSLTAVRILNMVCRLPNVNFQILSILTQNENIQNEIRQGFVECLESEITIAMYNAQDSVGNAVCAWKTELQIKEAIIELLQDCVPQPVPNIAYFLLGFDSTKDVLLNQRQRISAIDSDNNCTKSLISLLDNHLKVTGEIDTYNVDIQRIMERAYFLLYSLCANQRTSDSILRYLRSSGDFLSRHCSAIPFTNIQSSYVLNQMSHLLKCTAIELKVTASNCQISRYQHLSELLVGIPGKTNQDNTAMELNHCYSHSSNIFVDTSMGRKASDKVSSLLVGNLLDALTFEAHTQKVPKWDFFDNSLMGQILSECEMKTEQGEKLINIKKLHAILNDELHTVQNAIASGQRKLILQEIESVLSFALAINDDRKQNYATVKVMEACGQVLEILFSCAPDSAIPVSTKRELVLEILQRILSKIVPIQPIFEISILASGTVLLLLVNLRYYHSKRMENSGPQFDNKIISTALERENTSTIASSKSNSLSLNFVLKNILEWIIVSGVASQKLRINLYAALLNCLHVIKENDSKEIFESNNDFYLSRLDKTVDQYNGLSETSHRLSLEIFLSFGDKLIDIVCHDCINGHDICKMTALSCIDSLLDLDSMTGIINFITNRGYLLHIIESLIKSDEDLCRILCSSPDNIKSLYIYESVMAMLVRLASSHMGAELLLTDKVLAVLSNMKVFSLHPDFQANNFSHKSEQNEFVPPVDDRFRQILFPAINLCDCIISTLGPENHSAISQVTHFVLSHCDMFEIVLRSASPFMNLGLLQELAATTGLIARITNQEVLSQIDPSSNKNAEVNLYRIQHLMLSAFARFIITEVTLKDIFKPENILYDPTDANKALHVKYFLEIAANLSLYCRNAIANHSADHRANSILFSPTITEVVQRGDSRNNTLKKPQSLGVVINQLKGSVEYFNSQKTLTDNLLRQISSLPNLSFEANAMRTYSELTERYHNKKNELSLCTFITEQCLYLLWSHLDFYLQRGLETRPLNISYASESLSSSDPAFRKMIASEDVNLLKKNLISIFNETFCKQLLSTSDADKRFNEALLRRIKYLIQFVSVNYK